MPMFLCSGSPSETGHQMYKWKSIIMRLFVVSVASWLLCSCAYAQGADNRNNYKRFRISVGGGLADYYMPRLSGSYPVSAEYPWPDDGLRHGRITGGPGTFLKAGYYFSTRASVSVGVMHLRGSKKDILYERAFLDDYYNRGVSDDEFRASMTSPFVEIQYAYPVKPVEFSVAMGITYIFADASYNQVPVDGPVVPPNLPLEQKDFHSRGVGYLASFGVSYGISKTIFVNSETGYRFLRTEDLKDDEGQTWQDMHLDFSGPYFSAGLSFRL
jgi:hypothetical protein